MRLVIDLQGAQSESRYRGIGRYSLSLARAIAENRGDHEIIIVLSSLFPDSIEPLKNVFRELLPQENIKVWNAPGPVLGYEQNNQWRRKAAEYIREAYFESLDPDLVFFSSFMEGFAENTITSIGHFTSNVTTVVTLYDLIPLLNPEEYLLKSKLFEDHYMRKIEQIKMADGFLAISEYSAMEGIKELGLSPGKVVNISSACEPFFCIKQDELIFNLNNFGIFKPYIMFTGGADPRKNLVNLLFAYTKLSTQIKNSHQLVIVGKLKSIQIKYLKLIAISLGLNSYDLVFTGYVSDENLVDLYNNCDLFVFPSWHEGFGLPALEAINCGVPVIGSKTSSLPEVIGSPEALFDPYDPIDISEKMERVLIDKAFKNALTCKQFINAKNFNWNLSAKKAISFFEKTGGKKADLIIDRDAIIDRLLLKIANIKNPSPIDSDLKKTAMAIALNHPIEN